MSKNAPEEDKIEADSIELGRREFLALLSYASSAALAMSAWPGATIAFAQNDKLDEMAKEAASTPKSTPAGGYRFFSEREVAIVRTIIDGIIPPHLEIRKKISLNDGGYNPVKVFEDFVIGVGGEYPEALRKVLWVMNHLPQVPGLFEGVSARQLIDFEKQSEVTDFFIKLRDHSISHARNLFRFCKVIGTQAIYSHEKVVWKEMRYSGPWLKDPKNVDEDYGYPTSFALSGEMESRLKTLKDNVVAHEGILSSLNATETAYGLKIETDVLIVGTGAGGAVAAAELSSRGQKNILMVEMGDFIEPKYFLQRERLMVPRVYSSEISGDNLLPGGLKYPTLNSVVVRGKMVGGSATINHALCFDIPERILKEWNQEFGVKFTPEKLAPHFKQLRDFLFISPVAKEQVNRNNELIGVGADKLGYKKHGIADRNVKDCRGCGFCDTGCRYNRKQTPLLCHLPLAAKQGVKILPNCEVERFEFSSQLVDNSKKQISYVKAYLIDSSTGQRIKEVRIVPKKVILAAGSPSTPRILIRSGLQNFRTSIGKDSAVGKYFSNHAPMTLYGEFDEPIFQNLGGPPQSYYLGEFGPEHNSEYNAFKWEGIFNHPMVQAQLSPYETPEKHWEFMSRYNNTMCMALIFRDRPVGKIGPDTFEYKLDQKDRPAYLKALKIGAELIFAAGAKRVYTPHLKPLIMNSSSEIASKLNGDILDSDQLLITSAHPMGGARMGSRAEKDVVSPSGECWDIKNVYVTDASLFPTSICANPMLTIAALARAIASELPID